MIDYLIVIAAGLFVRRFFYSKKDRKLIDYVAISVAGIAMTFIVNQLK